MRCAGMVLTASPKKLVVAASREPLNGNQIRGFWAAWGGWALDGMDSFIYALVMVPALRELLPRSGIPDTPANEGLYGGLLFALFLVGWGMAFLWGPLADRFGRVRTLMLTIAWYSLFTFLGAVATRVWQLAAFRLLAGIGIGGEWAMGGTFVAEEWPESRRKMGAGLMHTGYYFGFFLAALLNYIVGTKYGWRAMFAVGGAPALLIGFIRYGVTEPNRWVNKVEQIKSWSVTRSFFMFLSLGTISGCIVLPAFAERLGRRATLGLYFAVMLVFIPLAFGYAFYLPTHALSAFITCLPFLGFGGANFAMYTLWLPEQYPTECRASAFALAISIGRFVGAGITFLVGAGVSHFHSIGIPVALTSVAFVLGLALLPFGEETTGKPLPA